MTYLFHSLPVLLVEFYSIPGLLVIGLQIYCAVHVIRTGREFLWLWLILLFPGIGALIYFFAEVYPDLKRRRGGPDLSMLKSTKKRIAELEEELQFTNTIKNRTELARLYAGAGMNEKAIEMFESCLQGPYKDDPYLLLGLGYAQFHNGDPEATLETLKKLDQVDSREYRDDQNLLLARALAVSGEQEKALGVYEELVKSYSGEEARCRYAMLLNEMGRSQEAEQIFADILVKAKRSPGLYRKHEKQWISLAKRMRTAQK